MGSSESKQNLPSEKIEEQQPIEDADSSCFTCAICIEPVPSNRKYKINESCSQHSFCMDCVAKYIQALLQEHNLSKIKCPGLECDQFLDPVSCCTILPQDIFVRWCDVLCESALSEYSTAYCPYQDCSSLILNECRGKVEKAKCPYCKRWLCFQCQHPWHAGYRCSERVRDENDVLFGQLMEKRKWKRCPVCKHGVERNDGCPIILCRCGTEFCHDCGRRWCRCKLTCLCNNTCHRSAFLAILLIIFVLAAIYYFYAIFTAKTRKSAIH